ncbi:AAA domain-containing protein [Lentinula novae-zelandiae]|nr:AAA domain-containing protein [Lentinula novae-zelandiae]
MSSQGTIVQLTENFRLNPDLGEFVSTIYSKAFRPQKVQARRIAVAFSLVSRVESPQPTDEYIQILNAVHDFLLGLSNLHTVSRKHRENVGYELHVKAEAAVASALIATIQEYLPGEDIFVATPHRIQRQAVKAALSAGHFDTSISLSKIFDNMSIDGGKGKNTLKSTVTVDTVERLQGSEAAFVICLFSLPQSHIADLHFLLERRRLNVAISRAKSMCILISSAEVLRPSVGALTDEETAKGYTFLRAFADRAWSSNITVDIDAL